MRAVVLRGGQLEVRSTGDPKPGQGELLLRTLSTAICASDVHFMDHPELAVDDSTGRSLYDANRDLVLGHEFVGEVIGYGPGCSAQLPIGTRVTSMPIRLLDGFRQIRIIGQHPEAQGSFGELLVVPEVLTKAARGPVSDDAIALVDAFAVGEFYVRISRIEPDEIPLVVGAGAIGLSAVAALASRRVEPIIVSDFKAERRALATQFGAQIAVDPAERSPFDVWRAVAAQRACSRPPVIYECVGAAGLVQDIIVKSEFGSRIFVAGGWYSGDSISCTTASRQGVALQFGGGPQPEDWYGTLEAVLEGRLDPTPCIGRTIGLDEVPAALAETRRGEGPPRIVVHPNG